MYMITDHRKVLHRKVLIPVRKKMLLYFLTKRTCGILLLLMIVFESLFLSMYLLRCQLFFSITLYLPFLFL